MSADTLYSLVAGQTTVTDAVRWAMPGYCRECEKPTPHQQRTPLPGWTYLPILATVWTAANWVLILLARHQW